jgi:PAS domain S-box-containing protein
MGKGIIMNPQKKQSPFSHYLLGFTFLLILAIVVGIAIVDYNNAQITFQNDALLLQNQTESNIENSVHLIDTGLKLFDNTLNQQMQQGFVQFSQEYEQSGGNPARMDLAGLKQRLGGKMDLYIINESGVVEYTTYTPDLGLDFKTTAPYFYDYITEMRLSGGFFPDRVVQEINTGKIRKFAYMPTSDHRYLLELGLPGDEFKADRNTLRYTDGIEAIALQDPYVKNVRIFTTAKRLVGNKSYVPDTQLSTTLDHIFQDRTSIEIFNAETDNKIKYLFINLTDPDYAADMSLVVELTYDNALVQTRLNNLVLFHIFVAAIALLIGLSIATVVSRYLTRPIRGIVDDVDQIAKGDLDHTISPTRGREFAILERSINTMVSTLKTAILKLQDSEVHLKSSEERYRAVVHSQNEFIARFLPDGTITFVNDAYCRYFGVQCTDIIGHRSQAQYPGSEREMIRTHLLSLSPENPAGTIEHRVITPDGGCRWQQWNDRAIFSDTGVLLEYQSVGRDITDQKQAEDALKQSEEKYRMLNEELEQRVRERTAELESANKELESFSYTVSHDLRAPLRAIDGFSLILIEEFLTSLPPDAQRYLNKVRQNTRHMSYLIDDLLNFSRMSRQPLNKQIVAPEPAVREALDELRSEQEKRSVEIRIGDLPVCYADPVLLKQVYVNLISNALKFTRKREKALIEIGSSWKDGQSVYFVQDNGVGFDMQYADSVFGVFQRLNNSDEYEGTGVGLAIVQRIIQRHGGKIWVDSAIDRGTTFFFTLGGI